MLSLMILGSRKGISSRIIMFLRLDADMTIEMQITLHIGRF